jgi:exodeoxyribonuclease-5
MKDPNYRLETIHRNAGEIAQFAQWLRQGNPWYTFKGNGSKVRFIQWARLQIQNLINADQIICAYNKTRVELNNDIRAGMGFSGMLNPNEKVICLRNNKKEGLFNGMQGIVVKTYSEEVGKFGWTKHFMDLLVDDELYTNVSFDPKQFGIEKYDSEHYNMAMPNPFDYAYALSCHKCQGSQFDRVVVIEQKNRRWNHQRWAYTAASRAKESLLWVTS